MDYFNGINNNYLGKKIKSGALTVAVFLLIALVVSLGASLFLVTKTALLIIAVLTIGGLIFIRTRIKKLNRYEDVECGKDEFFANQKVMIFVPHEDDDINLMGGVIEQYVKYGSDVYVAFTTNGDGDKRYDMSKMGFIRMHEAIESLALLGVSEKNIIFLGYGDGWGDNGPHIYNAEPNKIIKSTSGKTATFGLENHPAYHNGKTYTYSHYYDDIRQILLEYKPDVVFCIDYDTHNDHRALSMFFEKVMGNILKTTDYFPTVYKGYGYRTAWGSAPDFSESVNIKSTVSYTSNRDVELYDWNKRIRIPVDINSINRYLQQSKLYKALSIYDSQNAIECANRIINGDKVFWLRRTDSVLYNAEISVSSGNKDKLTDFMLLDCNDLINRGNYPYDGVWHPDINDTEKSVNVTLDKKQYIESIALYDNPSPDDNILNAVITLDDGTVINTGKLNTHGEANIIMVNKTIQSFTVQIADFEGECFGLNEIEAYGSILYNMPHFYKFTDAKDNFIYDYIIPLEGKISLKIYSNYHKKIEPKEFILRCDNRKCVAELSGEEIIVTCPVGEKCKIELLSQDNKLLDRIVLRNPCKIERKLLCRSSKFLNNKSYFNKIYKLIKKMCNK